ncbi:MAG: hypothetical protein DHS20C02_19790 [Micavibrio sp.]|nr:MAG: hypothetical protein DHS20C02_19790 [Micavibrio sp.]
MSSFTLYILTAFALVFVIEGLIYALFPDSVRKMMAMAIQMPPEKLRMFGFVMAATGFGLVWLLQAW